jgi:hypothetical protein
MRLLSNIEERWRQTPTSQQQTNTAQTKIKLILTRGAVGFVLVGIGGRLRHELRAFLPKMVEDKLSLFHARLTQRDLQPKMKGLSPIAALLAADQNSEHV